MSKMKWTPECRMGFEEIDSQHRLLFAIANEILDIDSPMNQELELKYLFRHLREYVEKHFLDEEKLMADKKYPKLEDHKQKHLAIVNSIKDTLKESNNLIALRKNLDEFLDFWIKQHILIEDKQFAKWHEYHEQQKK